MADSPPAPVAQAGEGSAARRVAANAVSPFAAQIVTKVLMMGYLIAQYRVLGNGRLGDYLIAALLFMYTGTIADWGLSTLVTREVSKVRGTGDEAARLSTLFRETLAFRLLVSALLLVPVALFVGLYTTFFGLSAGGAWAVVILTLSLVPGAFAASVTSVLYAYERMSLPAAVGIGTALLNVAIGVGALLMGWGVVGLALAASLTTLFTAAFFGVILRRDFPTVLSGVRHSPVLPKGAAVSLLKAGWPLMLNALLVGLFFRIDQFIIKPSQGSLAVEQYGAAYSFLNFVLLITPAATLALFPRMSRHAATDRPRLAYEYAFALKVLLVLSVPLVALTVWFAPLLVSILTGWKPGYLPQASDALSILIFFLPLSFVNGVTQYVLIALDKQSLITRAFGATVLFNLLANLVLVPVLGINGAALTTILSEVVLLVPFIQWTGREIGSVPLISLSLKPFAGGLAVGAVGWLLRAQTHRWQEGWGDFALFLLTGALLLVVYALVMFVLRPFNAQELTTLRRAAKKG